MTGYQEEGFFLFFFFDSFWSGHRQIAGMIPVRLPSTPSTHSALRIDLQRGFIAILHFEGNKMQM